MSGPESGVPQRFDVRVAPLFAVAGLLVHALLMSPAAMAQGSLVTSCKSIRDVVIDGGEGWVTCGGKRLVRFEVATGRIVDDVRVPKPNLWGVADLELGSNALWTTDSRKLYRLDRATLQLKVHSVVVPDLRDPASDKQQKDYRLRLLSVDEQSVWVRACNYRDFAGVFDCALVRLDLEPWTGVGVRVLPRADGVVSASGSVWTVHRPAPRYVQEQVLKRLDPDTGETLSEISLGPESHPFFPRPGSISSSPRLVVGAGSIWTSGWTPEGYAVLRVDMASDRLSATIPLASGTTSGARPIRMKFQRGRLTILVETGDLVDVDPATNRISVRSSGSRSDPYRLEPFTGWLKRSKGAALAGASWLDQVGPFRVTDTGEDPSEPFPAPFLHGADGPTDRPEGEAGQRTQIDCASPDYRIQGSPLRVELLSPGVVQAIYKGGAEVASTCGFQLWDGLADGAQSTITIQAVPIVRRKVLSWLGYGWDMGKREVSEPIVRRIALMRHGNEIAPITSRVVCDFDELMGCFASYTYAPDVFDAQGALSLRVFTSDRNCGRKDERIERIMRTGVFPTGNFGLCSDPHEIAIPARTVDRLRSDFGG